MSELWCHVWITHDNLLKRERLCVSRRKRALKMSSAAIEKSSPRDRSLYSCSLAVRGAAHQRLSMTQQ